MKENSVTDEQRRSFFTIDNKILDDFSLNPLELTIYCHLKRHSKNGEKITLSNSDLAKRYKKSRTSIITAINSLIDKTLVQKIKQSNGSSLNEYTMTRVVSHG